MIFHCFGHWKRPLLNKKVSTLNKSVFESGHSAVVLVCVSEPLEAGLLTGLLCGFPQVCL